MRASTPDLSLPCLGGSLLALFLSPLSSHCCCLQFSLLTFFISSCISHTDHRPLVKIRLGPSPRPPRRPQNVL